MSPTPSGFQVGAVMTKNPVTVDVHAPLSDASRLMDVHDCRHLAVTESDTLVGILSSRDILLAANAANKEKQDITVGDAYIAYPYHAASTDPLVKALDSMMGLHISSTLVVDNGKLVGILTTYDVCRVLRDLLEDDSSEETEIV
ncbi:MAG: CBS domain-containing protein [Bdellovibrionales bacterium]|nr:CBS domain-containing protein [Bdellovibrionales bacterium]